MVERKSTKKTYNRGYSTPGLGAYVIKSAKIEAKYDVPWAGAKVHDIFLKDPISQGWVLGQAKDSIDKYVIISESRVIDAIINTKYDAQDHKITNVTISFYKGFRGKPYKTIKF